MNNDKFDAITGDKFVCCCDCGKWFPSTKAFTKFYSSTAFMLCSKCANKLEQDIRRYKVEEAPATDVVEVRHGRWIRKEETGKMVRVLSLSLHCHYKERKKANDSGKNTCGRG